MNIKRGFSLAELLIVMAIVGVLTAVGLHTFLVNDKGVKYLLSNTYYALDRAVYNVTLSEQDASGWQFYNAKENPLKIFDDQESDGQKAAENLCKGIAWYITPVEGDGACSNGMNIDINGTDAQFNNPANPPMFTAINGVRFWMTPRLQIETGDIRYFVIFADMNGAKGPNSLRYIRGNGQNQSTKDPDIFAFVAFAPMNAAGNVQGLGESDARVIPIGIMDVEPRYLTARYTYQEDASAEELTYSTPSTTIVMAKRNAGGYYDATDAPNGPSIFNTLSFGETFKVELQNSTIGIYPDAYNVLYNEQFTLPLDEHCNNNSNIAEVGDICGVFIDKYMH